MARSRSRSASTRPYESTLKSTKAVTNPKAAVPSLSRRRVTRSQSRDPENSGLENAVVGTGRPSLNGPRWKQNMGKSGKGLDAVVEESPVRSPAKSPRNSGARRESHAAPGSPEDAANISGTTILPSEPDTDLDPEMMLESLPDLERAARDVLKLLVPASTDPVSIVNLAAKLADPKNTQSRRLSRSKSKFESEASYFGSHSYIDTERVSEAIYSALENKCDGLANDWTPDLSVQKANCARFAIEVLLARTETDAPRQAIQHVEGLFPSVFMNNVVHDGQRPAVGESSLGKDTFNLALEIRTQFLIASMEDQQHDPGFDPDAILKLAFFVEEIDEDVYDSNEAPLRGFNLDNLGGADGYLPSRYRDAAYDRFNEMRVLVSDGPDELKSAFRWPRFALKAAQWLRKRNDEIDKQLNKQRQADDLKDEYFATPKTGSKMGSVPPRSAATLSPAGRASARPSSVAAENQRIMAARGSPFAATPTRLRISSNLRELETPGVSGTEGPIFTAPSIQPRISDAQKEPAVPETSNGQGSPTEGAPIDDGAPKPPSNEEEPRTAFENRERRKSKPSFLNASSIDRIMQRQRRRSDFVQPSPQAEGDTLASEDQSNTLPATSQSRAADPVAPAAPAAPEAPVEPANMPDPHMDSPLFVPQDDDLLTINDTGFTLDGDNSRIQIERSHSPPVGNRISHGPGRQRTDSIASIPVNPPSILPSDRELWQATKKHAASSSQATKDKHPRAAFIDHQENAHRVSPISHGVSSRSAQRSSNKRRRDESDDLEENEESGNDFSTDARALDISRKRAEKPAQPTSKRQRTTTNEEPQAAPEVPGESRATRRGSATIPYRSSQLTSTNQSHVRWQPAEDERLLRLIKENECKWALIEQENEAQPEKPGEKRIEGRNQVQLKDRARNLKIKYYRARQPLPKNLEKVTMKQKDKARLANMGIIVPDN
ncbi:uncharacterized protein LDX57_004232 [Aspergillus melleus]|uniref:uncharacterized protein n=1 Tax=Aspergillus melleus TaxID=138277 RepID=UPI001E8CB2F3|nr:uncharacterized protein LDX57_004232 [Aspergillus melleus]KAH8426497.1 hypothetical protein LDX57_004232 [Aspergillus melleus]